MIDLVTAFLPAALSGAALGLAIYSNHRLRVFWIMAHRREVVLGRLVAEAGEALMEGMDFQDFCKLWDRHIIAFADEVHNQQLHSHGFWVRVPSPDKPWPNAEPAPTMGLGE